MSVVSYTKAKIDALLGLKQDAGDYATNTALTSGLSSKVDSSTYTAGLAGKADLVSGTVPDVQLPTRLSDVSLKAAYVPRWQANTPYTAGQAVLNPSGQIVTANATFTSSASYSAANWTVVSGGSSLPTQTGNAGRFLTTDGTNASWGTAASGSVPAQQIVLAPSGDTTGATDQAALIAARNTLLGKTVRGGTIVLGAGDWYWPSVGFDLYNTPARLRIVGQGQATRIHSTATGTPGLANALFYVYGGGDVAPYTTQTVHGAVGINWVEIADVALIGNANACGIALSGCYQGRLANIYAEGFSGSGKYAAGIYLASSIEVTVENPVTFGCNYGMYLEGWSNINNVLGGWLSSSLTAGASVQGSAYGNNFHGTVFQTAGVHGIEIGAGMIGTHLMGCWIENNSVGAWIGGSGTVLDGTTFANNTVDLQALSGATQTIISRPTFQNGGFGNTPRVEVDSGSHYTVIEHPPTSFAYASHVVDGTGGAEVYIVRASAVGGTGTTAPAPVTALTVGTPTGSSVPLSWTAPGNTGGSAITDYTVQYRTTAGPGAWTAFAHTAQTATSITVTGLTASTAYDFRVAPVNAVGAGGWSATASASTSAGGAASVPGAPTSLAAGTPSSSGVPLSWTAPASNGGAAITDYAVQYRTTAGPGAWTTFADGTSTTTSATVTGLSASTGYDFQVAAVNSAGTGAYSATASATTAASGAFSPLTTLNWTAAYWASDPSWTAPANGGAVTSWRDGSGHAHAITQATGAAQPSYTASVANLNSKPAVHFGGAQILTAPTGVTQAQTFTVVAIAANMPSSANMRLFTSVDGGGTGLQLIQLVLDAGVWSSYAGEAGNPIPMSPANLTADYMMTVFAGAATRDRSAGVDHGPFALGTSGISNGITVGGRSDGLYFTGDVAFIGLYPGDITADANYSAFTSWINTFYGITP